MKFRKKPVIIEAIKYDGKNYDEIKHFMNVENVLVNQETNQIVIETLEGAMSANVSDFIIKGVKGEFYPCKPDIFEQTYEKIEE